MRSINLVSASLQLRRLVRVVGVLTDEEFPSADLYTSPLSAAFSEQTGFASLITHSVLYVWSYLVRARERVTLEP